MVTKIAWKCQTLTVTPLDLLGDDSAGSSGSCHSPGLSLACPIQVGNHGKSPSPWTLWEPHLKLAFWIIPMSPTV